MLRADVKTAFIGLAIAILSGPASATVRIMAGDHVVPADRTDVLIPIMMTGDATERLQGIDLYLQIGDGGDYAGGVDSHPSFPAMIDANLISGDMVFGPNDWQFMDFASNGLIVGTGTVAKDGTVDPNGLLGTVTLDTTGATPGATYPLYLGNPNIFVTDLAGALYPLVLVDGSITIESPPQPPPPTDPDPQYPPPDTDTDDPVTPPIDPPPPANPVLPEPDNGTGDEPPVAPADDPAQPDSTDANDPPASPSNEEGDTTSDGEQDNSPSDTNFVANQPGASDDREDTLTSASVPGGSEPSTSIHANLPACGAGMVEALAISMCVTLTFRPRQ